MVPESYRELRVNNFWAKMKKLSKLTNLGRNLIGSNLRKGPLFIHISPTTRCNLRCSYCYQVQKCPDEMSYESFEAVVRNSLNLGISIISFSGGEPLLWRHVVCAVQLCTDNRIVTQITTNGTLLTKELVDTLGNVGLNMLSVSLDGIDYLAYSQKTLANNPNVLEYLKYANEKYGMVVAANTVLCKQNRNQLEKIIGVASGYKVPLSIGLVVEPPNGDKWKGSSLSFNFRTDREEIQSAISYILSVKQQGHVILDPDEYFENLLEFTDGKYEWDCTLAKKRTVQIGPNGKVYWCSKLNQFSPYVFNNMTLQDFHTFMSELDGAIRKCNKICYSNCAFFSYYYHKHQFEFIRDIAVPLISQNKGILVKR